MARVNFAFGCALLLTACGARSQLFVPSDDSASVVDAAPRDVAVMDVPAACTTDFAACRPIGSAIDVSGGTFGQMPDVAWTGREILVVFDSGAGNALVVVSRDGAIVRRDELGGLQSPRVTWNSYAHAGLVVMDSAVRWLDADARPVGSLTRAEISGWQLYGDAAPVADGFVAFSGTNAYSTPPPLYRARLGTTPSPVVWEQLADGAPRSPPERVVGDDGLARWMLSGVWFSAMAEAYPIAADGTIGPSVNLAPALGSDSRLCGAAEIGGTLLVLTAAMSLELSLALVRDGAVTRAVPNSFAAPRSGCGHITRMGDVALVAAERSDRATGVQVATVDRNGAVGIPLLVGPSESQSPRIAATDRGFVVVWNEAGANGLSARAQIFDCCAP